MYVEFDSILWNFDICFSNSLSIHKFEKKNALYISKYFIEF